MIRAIKLHGKTKRGALQTSSVPFEIIIRDLRIGWFTRKSCWILIIGWNSLVIFWMLYLNALVTAVRWISIFQFIWTVANVALEQMPGAGMNFFVFMFVVLNCHYQMCLVGNFYGNLIFKTNRYYHFYLDKSCVNLLQCLPFPVREALCLCTTAGVWVISLFGHVLFSNMHQELSGAGLVMSCLEKEGFKSASGHRETECSDLNWDWNGSFTTVSTYRLLWLVSFTYKRSRNWSKENKYCGFKKFIMAEPFQYLCYYQLESVSFFNQSQDST